MLPDKQVKKFQELYKSCFNKEISREEAYEQGIKLMRLVEIVYRPMTIKEHEILQERRRNTR